MDDTKKKFLEAEEMATTLAKTLQDLQGETSSYKTAKEDLNTVREKLLLLIESTENVVKNSNEVVKILKEIGGPEILDRLDKSIVLMEMTEKTGDKSHEIVKEFKEVGEVEILRRLANLKYLLLITLASSLVAIIISSIVLFR